MGATYPTKLLLAFRSGNRCAFPECTRHLFDGVDERQRALALETAAKEASIHGFQYICTLNSDYIPWNEFSKDFNLRDFIRVSLTDKDVTGCLLGVRF